MTAKNIGNFGKMLPNGLANPRKMSQRLEMCLVNVVFVRVRRWQKNARVEHVIFFRDSLVFVSGIFSDGIGDVLLYAAHRTAIILEGCKQRL